MQPEKDLQSELGPRRAPAVPGTGKLLGMNQNHAIVIWDQLVLVFWRGECDRDFVQRFECAALYALRRRRGNVAVLSVVEDTAPPLSEDARKLAAETNDRLTRHGLVGIAIVLSQRGFPGSIMRGALTSVTLLSRGECPLKVFEDPQPAALWLSERLSQRGHRMGALECAEVIGHWRRRYAAYWHQTFGSAHS